jgi:hypothetical protein
MKTLFNYQPNQSTFPSGGASGFHQPVDLSNRSRTSRNGSEKIETPSSSFQSGLRPSTLLTEEAIAEIARGGIPDFEQVCHDLYHTFLQPGSPNTALQFIPVLKKLNSIPKAEAEQLVRNPATSHILVQNALMKVVLICWKPGKISSIHGHPKGGCVFKVLKGNLEEKRYSPDEGQRLLAVSTFQPGSMAYIDDNMAYHAVGNPFETAAISLHVYTPGVK